MQDEARDAYIGNFILTGISWSRQIGEGDTELKDADLGLGYRR